MDKLHKNEEFLRVEVLQRGRNSKEIAKRLRVSYKLVELYLMKYNIPFESQRPREKDV
jgi:transposase